MIDLSNNGDLRQSEIFTKDEWESISKEYSKDIKLKTHKVGVKLQPIHKVTIINKYHMQFIEI